MNGLRERQYQCWQLDSARWNWNIFQTIITEREAVCPGNERWKSRLKGNQNSDVINNVTSGIARRIATSPEDQYRSRHTRSHVQLNFMESVRARACVCVCVYVGQKGIERTRGYYWTFIEKKRANVVVDEIERCRRIDTSRWMTRRGREGTKYSGKMASRKLLCPQNFRNWAFQRRRKK